MDLHVQSFLEFIGDVAGADDPKTAKTTADGVAAKQQVDNFLKKMPQEEKLGALQALTLFYAHLEINRDISQLFRNANQYSLHFAKEFCKEVGYLSDQKITDIRNTALHLIVKDERGEPIKQTREKDGVKQDFFQIDVAQEREYKKKTVDDMPLMCQELLKKMFSNTQDKNYEIAHSWFTCVVKATIFEKWDPNEARTLARYNNGFYTDKEFDQKKTSTSNIIVGHMCQLLGVSDNRLPSDEILHAHNQMAALNNPDISSKKSIDNERRSSSEPLKYTALQSIVATVSRRMSRSGNSSSGPPEKDHQKFLIHATEAHHTESDGGFENIKVLKEEQRSPNTKPNKRRASSSDS